MPICFYIKFDTGVKKQKQKILYLIELFGKNNEDSKFWLKKNFALFIEILITDHLCSYKFRAIIIEWHE